MRHLPALDYINQSIYFPWGAGHKSLQIPVKLDNRRNGAPRVSPSAVLVSFIQPTLMAPALSNFGNDIGEERRARATEVFEKTNTIIGWKQALKSRKTHNSDHIQPEE